MTTERDPNQLIAAWLEEGPRDLPSDTRRAIETAVRAMPQRRLGLGRSWRFPLVHGSLRPGLVLAAVLISVVGLAVFGRLRPNESVGTQSSPTPVPTAASLAPSFAPTPGPLVGRIAFDRWESQAGMYGKYLGTYTANADGSDVVKLDLPAQSDGVHWSPDGSRLLLSNSPPKGATSFRPAIVNADGTGYRRLEVSGVPATAGMGCDAWSPDGTRILCGIADDNDPTVGGIVVIDVASDSLVARISSGAFPGVKGTKSECRGGDSSGAWSPDGTRVVFVRHQCGAKPDPVQNEQAAIYIANADGTGTPQIIVANGYINSGEPQISWSPDGQWLLFSDGGLSIAHPDGSAWRRILTDLNMGTYHYSPAWSPDGTRLIFAAYQGQTDIWTTSVDGAEKIRITNDAASEDSISWTR